MRPVEREVSGIGNGPIAAFLNAISNFGVDASIMDYAERRPVRRHRRHGRLVRGMPGRRGR